MEGKKKEKQYIKFKELPSDYKPYRYLLGTAHPIVLINGVLRFERNSVIRYLIDEKIVSLNTLAVDLYEGKFSIEDFMEFYRDMGYSLSGFIDIFEDKYQEFKPR